MYACESWVLVRNSGTHSGDEDALFLVTLPLNEKKDIWQASILEL